MNKAFTKETDDAPTAPPEERPVSSALNLVTPRGAQLIKEQIAATENKLGAEADPVIKSELRRDLRYWLARQSSMQIVSPKRDIDSVGFGSRVTIRRGTAVLTVSIVGEDEAPYILERKAKGEKPIAIARALGISRASVFRVLKTAAA